MTDAEQCAVTRRVALTRVRYALDHVPVFEVADVRAVVDLVRVQTDALRWFADHVVGPGGTSRTVAQLRASKAARGEEWDR